MFLILTKKSNNQINYSRFKFKTMARLLLIIGLILIVLWLLGVFALNLSAPVLHALIIIGVILIILDLLNSRRRWW